jgi:TonB family protein
MTDRPPKARISMLTSSARRLGASLLLLLLALTAAAQDEADVTHVLDPTAERQPLQTIVPVYPVRALQDRIQGDVEVCFSVDREGRTSRVAVRNSSHRMFEKPAMLAVRASSYVPLQEHEILSGIKTCRIFRFRLDPVAIEDPADASVSIEP